MNITEKELGAGFRRSKMSSIRGDRTRHLVTHNPNTASPGEELYVDIPKLKASSCLVPGSLHIIFDFEVTGTKSWFINNLSKGLQRRHQVRLAGECVYDCDRENLYSTYKDLWMSNSERNNMIEYGISNENIRKLISGDDTGASSGNDQKANDALLYGVYSKRQRIRLDKIIADHGVYAPFLMNNNPRYIITLPSSSEVLIAQRGETLGAYSLENIQLEYETIDDPDLASQVTSLYSTGRSLSYEHVTLMKTVVWNANDTLVNENVNLPRKSMKAIVLLFNKSIVTDSEEFVYPNIDSIKLTIEGVPNAVYSQGIPKSRLYDEACRLFSQGVTDQFMTVEKFFKDKFALVIDLRAHPDNEKTGQGRRLISTQNGVLLEIKKKAHTGSLKCHILIVSDGLVNMTNNDLQSIQY